MKRHALNIALGVYCWLSVPTIAGTLPAWLVAVSFFSGVGMVAWGLLGILAELERRAGLGSPRQGKPPLWVTVAVLVLMEARGWLIAGPQLAAMFA